MNLKAVSGKMLTEAPKPAPKKNRTGLYIGIVLTVVIVIGAIAYFASLPEFVPTPTPTPTKPIHHIDYFLVTKEDNLLEGQFALMSEDLDFVSTDGTVQLIINDETTNKTLYETEFTIKKSDFKYYQTHLGQTVLAYQWSVPISDVQKCISHGTAKITFTAPDGKSCSDTDEYVTLPKYTEEEIIQMYENIYSESAIAVDQTITKGHFSITLVRVGHFTHLEFDTHGDEVTEFRVDLKVTSIASEPEYIFGSHIVILDDLGSQYNYEYGGTLELGEIYPGVTREGYVLFPALNENATRITVIITETAYPEDIEYEFTVNLCQRAEAEGTIVMDGSLSDWLDLGISPLGIDSDDQWAGYADLRKFWAYIGDTNLYLAIQVDWEYPVDFEPVIFTILITPENSSSWYEVIWYNASRTILLGHGEEQGKIQNITSETGWDGVIEFSVPLSFIDNLKVMTLEVDSYSSDWIYNIDMMPAPWEEPYKIPEF